MRRAADSETRGPTGLGSARRELRDRRTLAAVGAITCIPLAQLVLVVAVYAATPGRLVFTGNPNYGEDGAQHELWAREMWDHGFSRNLLTPGRTARSWFFSPLEWLYGGLRAVTDLPYPVVTAVVALVCAPVFALALVALARRAGIAWPRSAAVLAAFAGGFGPVVSWLHDLGAPGFPSSLVHAAVSASGDATPAGAGIGPYQLLVALVLLGLALGADGAHRGFVGAGVAFAILAAVYPFYTPVLAVTTVTGLLLWRRRLGGPATRRAAVVTLVPPAVPALYYLLLPRVDDEFARFQRLNHLDLLSPKVLVSALALGLVALACVPWLLRSTSTRQLLGVLTLVAVVAVLVPAYPWRTHLFHFGPYLVLAAAAGVTMVLAAGLPSWTRAAVVGVGLLGVVLAVAATPYYLWRAGHDAGAQLHPEYLTRGEADAMHWLADRPGDAPVLAPSGAAPWVAAWGGHRTLVGHYLWTHHYERNRRLVDAVYSGADPRRLLRRFRVRWIVVDTATRPGWARGVAPAARFPGTIVLDAAAVLARSS